MTACHFEPASGLLQLFLVACSPILIDITRQARGCGLAFLAMSVLLVAALEASRSHRIQAICAFCAGGVKGTMTLPTFGIAFLATGAVLRLDVRMRHPFGIGLGISVVVSPRGTRRTQETSSSATRRTSAHGSTCSVS